MKKLIFMILGVFLTGIVLTTSAHVYAKNLNVTEPLEDISTGDDASSNLVTRGLKQSLINKNGELITGNPKYDYGAPDRNVIEEEMIPGKGYHRYVYDDSLTEEENQKLFHQLSQQAMMDYLGRLAGGELKDISDKITDKGIATSEGTTSIVE